MIGVADGLEREGERQRASGKREVKGRESEEKKRR